jgi:hypothetical protein
MKLRVDTVEQHPVDTAVQNPVEQRPVDTAVEQNQVDTADTKQEP